jgi:hypothetical protein
MTMLAKQRHAELVNSARDYRRVRAARPTSRFHRRDRGTAVGRFHAIDSTEL